MADWISDQPNSSRDPAEGRGLYISFSLSAFFSFIPFLFFLSHFPDLSDIPRNGDNEGTVKRKAFFFFFSPPVVQAVKGRRRQVHSMRMRTPSTNGSECNRLATRNLHLHSQAPCNPTRIPPPSLPPCASISQRHWRVSSPPQGCWCVCVSDSAGSRSLIPDTFESLSFWNASWPLAAHPGRPTPARPRR